jgi:hypothetical protein
VLGVIRLNGYFVSGFIVHSPEHGRNITQVDALAVRHKFNREPNRGIGPSPFLKPKGTDLLVCEVKSRYEPLHFNESFRNSDGAIRDVLRWAGLFDEEETIRIAHDLKPLLQPCTPAREAEMGVPGTGETIVRPLLCSPEKRSRRENQPWSLCGSEMFSYIAECLNPKAPRDACSIRYDINLWGSSLAPLVRYFKELLPPGDHGEIKYLYKSLSEQAQTDARKVSAFSSPKIAS